MADLIAVGALEGRAPVEAGGAWLGEAPVAPVTAIAPFNGQEPAVDAALRDALGLGFPPPGRVIEAAAGRIAWSGRGQALLLGAPAPALDGRAAVTDLSDGWVCLRLHGAGAQAVLARLVPMDLRPGAFPAGSAARSLLGHVQVLILARPDGFDLLVTRSFAGFAWHELDQAMRGLAARPSVA